RRELARVDTLLAELGGDERSRARELDLVRFQVSELDAAALSDPDEDERLSDEEDTLSNAHAHQEAAVAAVDALAGDGGAVDALGAALSSVADRAPCAALDQRLR